MTPVSEYARFELMHKVKEARMKPSLIEALQNITTGIYILTTGKGHETHGMIVSWVSQISFDPPLIMVAIRKNRPTHAMITRNKNFALSILKKEQKDLVGQFKLADTRNRFKGLKCVVAKTGVHIIGEALAYIDCELYQTIDVDDHTLFIGRMVDGDVLNKGYPLSVQEYGKIYLGYA
ncbi:MAG TPA: flavin reductase [Syntrophaceae bacterium]|nr:flavin reductase [Syntrophaceae bacterium]